MNIKAILGTVVILVLLAQVNLFASEDANSLYQKGMALERDDDFAGALTVFRQVKTDFPDSMFAGADYAGFRVKLTSLKLAIKANDTTAINQMIADIKGLPASAKEKPAQLYFIGRAFENAKRYKEAQIYFQQVIDTYPNDFFAGDSRATFRLKTIDLRNALDNDNITTVWQIEEEFKALGISGKISSDELLLVGGLLQGIS